MSSERAGVHTGSPEELAERYRASTGWKMAEGYAITDAFLAGYQAGVHTSGALNREKARDVLARKCPAINDAHGDDLLAALEACVVPDPRIGRIEALLSRLEADALKTDGGYIDGALSVIEQVRETVSDLHEAYGALEGGVVPDPRIGRIEALVAAYDDAGLGHTTFEHEVRAILRGDA